MTATLDVARVDVSSGLVVNVEVATAEWVAEPRPGGPWLWVAVTEHTGPAAIGDRYIATDNRFERMEVTP